MSQDLLEVVKGPGPREFALAGELDASTVQTLVDALTAQHEQPGDIYLDLADLLFVDSVGLSAFIAAARRLDGMGNLVLVSPKAEVERVLDVSGVDGMLPNLLVERGADRN